LKAAGSGCLELQSNVFLSAKMICDEVTLVKLSIQITPATIVHGSYKLKSEYEVVFSI
jgi:hypothetical protein